MAKQIGTNVGAGYFVLEDAEKKRRIAHEMQKRLDEAERAALKELHFMHCPKCGMPLQPVRHGKIEVDACFTCGGAFLDKKDIAIIAAPRQKGIMGAILNWFDVEKARPKR